MGKKFNRKKFLKVSAAVAERSRPVDFPDFTRGNWETKPPIHLV